MMRDWDWSPPDGKPDVGQPTTFTTETDDGYEISVTLQVNEDGVLVCSGLDIQFKNKNLVSDRPINSRYFQLLGLGEILQSARGKYLEWAGIITEVYLDMDSERETQDWPYPGATGHTDEKYAYLAYMYVRFIELAKPNPIDELAQHMNCDRETAASRIAEVRKRGLLTRPRQGVLGGRLTSKAEKILGIKKGKK
jgi:hypothetical protein